MAWDGPGFAIVPMAHASLLHIGSVNLKDMMIDITLARVKFCDHLIFYYVH